MRGPYFIETVLRLPITAGNRQYKPMKNDNFKILKPSPKRCAYFFIFTRGCIECTTQFVLEGNYGFLIPGARWIILAWRSRYQEQKLYLKENHSDQSCVYRLNILFAKFQVWIPSPSCNFLGTNKHCFCGHNVRNFARWILLEGDPGGSIFC